TVYKLTAEGRRSARGWIERAPETLEVRDEGLLGLFFAGSINPARTAEIARERAEMAASKAAQLRAIKEALDGAGADRPDASPDAGSLTVLRYGIEANEWAAKWFERAAEDLERGK
ncbi:MAG TPA: hypothetical protein VFL56_07010, partial [Solirubrobacterales bacterium]|nr:hypothetical protein [Solirubrobacterales bacterium]